GVRRSGLRSPEPGLSADHESPSGSSPGSQHPAHGSGARWYRVATAPGKEGTDSRKHTAGALMSCLSPSGLRRDISSSQAAFAQRSVLTNKSMFFSFQAEQEGKINE